MSGDILFRVERQAGIASLNKAGTIHALTRAMLDGMRAQFPIWAKDDAIGAVLIDHAEGRGFCSGGDIAYLRDSLLHRGGVEARQFFYDEYQLDHLIFEYPKPVVSFIDGIVMGGGVGIAQPARYRVATENTRFAMPETGIGLFPDVGAGWYLSRLPGRVGQYIALTGARLNGADCRAVGLATHYLPSEALAEAKARIAADPVGIKRILGALSVAPPEAKIMALMPDIDRLFASETLEGTLAALDADGSEWAVKEAAGIRSKCPVSCKVALRQLAEGVKAQNFAEMMQIEFRIAARVIFRDDFVEGVRAVVIDKDNAPKWNPATPEAATDAMIDAIFAPLPIDEEWKPL